MRALLFVSLVFGLVLGPTLGLAQDRPFDLGRILVSGKTFGPLGAESIIENKDLRAWGVENLAQALDFIPGVEVKTGKKGQAQIQVRGLSAYQIKILIDGVPAYENYARFLDLAQIPVTSIARIEIIRGPSSVLYGANTLGPVVNIVTKQGGAHTTTQLSGAVGDYGAYSLSLTQGGRHGPWSYWIGGRYADSPGFRLSHRFDPQDPYLGLASGYHEDGGRRELSYYQNRALNVKWAYQPHPNETYYLSLDFHHNNRGIPPEYDRFWAFDPWKQWTLNLGGKRQISPRVFLKAQGFYVVHRDILKDISTPEAQTLKKWFARSVYQDYTLGSNVNLALQHTGGLLRLAAHYQYDHHREQEFYDATTYPVLAGWATVGWQPQETYASALSSLAIEDELSLKGRYTLCGGVGYDHFVPLEAAESTVPHASDALNAQIGLRLPLAEKVLLQLAWSKKTRFPTLKELFSKHAGGNPNLGPERGLYYEADLRIGPSKAYFWLSLFTEKVKGLIQYNSALGFYENIGQARLSGGESGFSLRMVPRLLFRASYSYLWAADEDSHTRLPRRPRHRVLGELRLFLPTHLLFDLRGTYTADQIDYQRDGTPIPLEDYFLLDLYLEKGFSVRHRQVRIFGAVNNLLDANINDGHGPEPGRNFRTGIRVVF